MIGLNHQKVGVKLGFKSNIDSLLRLGYREFPFFQFINWCIAVETTDNKSKSKIWSAYTNLESSVCNWAAGDGWVSKKVKMR